MKIQTQAVTSAELGSYGISTVVHVTTVLARAMASAPMRNAEPYRREVFNMVAAFLAVDPGHGVALMLGPRGGFVAIRDRFGRGWLLAEASERLPREWVVDCILPC